jgi:hypothetical protein
VIAKNLMRGSSLPTWRLHQFILISAILFAAAFVGIFLPMSTLSGGVWAVLFLGFAVVFIFVKELRKPERSYFEPIFISLFVLFGMYVTRPLALFLGDRPAFFKGYRMDPFYAEAFGLADRSIDLGLIVPLDLPHVGGVEVVVINEVAFVPVEEHELVRALSMLEDATEEEVVVADEVAGMRWIGAQQITDLLRQFGRDLLVRVHIEEPIVTKREVLQAPLLLLGVPAVPAEVNDVGAKALGE